MKSLSLALALIVSTAPACRAQSQSHDSIPGMSGRSGADSIDRHAAAAADEVMNEPMVADQHMVMTPDRPPAPGDSARAAALLAEMRRDLAPFKSADSAIANGYRPLFPGVPQPVYHFTNIFNALGERLRDALNQLPERYRTALVLFDVEGYPQAEIAEILGVAPGTVRSAVFHARRRLRRLLGDWKEDR